MTAVAGVLEEDLAPSGATEPAPCFSGASAREGEAGYIAAPVDIPRLVPVARGAPDGSSGALVEARPGSRRALFGAVRAAAVVAVGVVAAYLLLPRMLTAARHWHTLRSPLWAWVGAVGVAAVAAHLMGAVVLTNSTRRRLRFTTTLSVGLATAFANRLAPSGLGAMATTVRYLRRSGETRSSAAVSVGLGSTAGFVVHALATTVAVALLAPHLLAGWRLPSYWPWVASGTLAVVGVGTLVGRRLAGPAREVVRASAKELRAVLACPRRSLGLLGGSAGVTLAYALGLAAAFDAYGVHIGLLDVVAVYLGGSALAAGSPTPGGMGAAEAALIATTTTLVGQTTRVVDAVLLFRLVTFWIPPLAGIPALFHLRRNATL